MSHDVFNSLAILARSSPKTIHSNEEKAYSTARDKKLLPGDLIITKHLKRGTDILNDL